jgi:hypothetical protein
MKESVIIAKQILNESSDKTNPVTIKRIDNAIQRWIAKEYNIPTGSLRKFSKPKSRGGDVWMSDVDIDITDDAQKSALKRLFKKIGLSVTIEFSTDGQVGGAVTFKYSYQHYSGQNGHTDIIRFTHDMDSRGNVSIKPE